MLFSSSSPKCLIDVLLFTYQFDCSDRDIIWKAYIIIFIDKYNHPMALHPKQAVKQTP